MPPNGEAAGAGREGSRLLAKDLHMVQHFLLEDWGFILTCSHGWHRGYQDFQESR